MSTKEAKSFWSYILLLLLHKKSEVQYNYLRAIQFYSSGYLIKQVLPLFFYCKIMNLQKENFMDKPKKEAEEQEKEEKQKKEPEKQLKEEDIEPDTTDNPGVTHISPECNEG
jgi:hypothetical protein